MVSNSMRPDVIEKAELQFQDRILFHNMSQSLTFKAAVLGSGNFLVTLTVLVSAAVLSRLLSMEAYAAYRQTFLVYTFVASFLTLGLPQALNYFIPRDKAHSRSILSGNLLLLFVTGVIFSMIIWLGGNEYISKWFNNPSLRRLLLIYSPYCIFAFPVASLGACMVACDQVRNLTIYNIISKLIFFGSVVVVTMIWRSSYAAVSAAVAATFIVFFPAIVLMYSATQGTDWKPRKNNMWAQLKYSIPLGAASALGIIQISIDKVIVSSMCAPEEFATYVNGAIEIPIISIITGAVTAVLVPEFVSLYKENRLEDLLNLWRRSVLKVSYFVFPMLIYMFIMSDEIIRVLFSDRYLASAIPFRIYLLLLIARITTFNSVEMAAGRTEIVLKIFFFNVVVNTVLTVLFIPIFGYTGAAIATVATTYFFSIPVHLYVYKNILKTRIVNLLPIKDLSLVMLFSLACAPLIFLKNLIPGPDAVDILITAFLYFFCITVVFRIAKITDFLELAKEFKLWPGNNLSINKIQTKKT